MVLVVVTKGAGQHAADQDEDDEQEANDEPAHGCNGAVMSHRQAVTTMAAIPVISMGFS